LDTNLRSDQVVVGERIEKWWVLLQALTAGQLNQNCWDDTSGGLECTTTQCSNRRIAIHVVPFRRIAEPTDELLELLSVLGRIVEPGLLIRHPIGHSAPR
jgi:hypothetical protein